MTEITPNSPDDILLDHVNVLNEATQLMTSVMSNLFGFFEDLAAYNAKQQPEAEKVIKETKEMAQKLTGYVDQVHGEIHALTGAIKDSHRELAAFKQSNDLLSTTLAEKDKLMRESHNKREALKKNAIVQANYTAAMGSIMGTMLWKTSKNEDAINTYISESMILQFISMSNVTLNSFVESYEKELPLLESNEHNMMIAVLGVSVNISAQIAGREFVVNEAIGITYIENILKYLGRFPMPSGQLLKRMSLMFLFNVSILRRGARIVKSSPNGIAYILGCLSPEHSTEIHTLVLQFVVFLLEQIQTEEFNQQIRSLISRVHLEQLMEENDDLRNLCLKLHKMIVEFKPPLSSF